MKALLLSLLLLSAFAGFGQKKKKTDAKDVQIDTLTKANALLVKQVDSISKDREVYYGLYTTIKEKVLKEDFDPANFSNIVDSVRRSRDSSAALGAAAPMQALKDSLAMMTKMNHQLSVRLDSLSHVAKNVDKSKLVAELKDLKSLLDAKVITQAEYDAKKKLVMDRWQ